MANAAELLVKLKGQTSELTTLTAYQPIDATIIGDGVLFSVNGDKQGWFPDTSTDVVTLVTTEGFAVALTRKGDYWQWLIGPSDLGTEDTDPAGSVTKTAYIVVERNASGVRTRLTSPTFTLIIKRMGAFMPNLISGLIGWYDAYSLTEAVAAVVTTWDDKSRLDRDVTEATNKPTRQDTAQGRPYLDFDGSNDLLTSTIATFGDPCTVFVVASIDSWDATVRGICQVGGTNGVRIVFDNANLKAITGSDEASMALPTADDWFVACATKTDDGAVTIQKGLSSVTTTASSAAVTAGTLSIGTAAGSTFADCRVSEVIVYDSVLSTGDRERVIRYLMQKWNAVG